MLVYHFELALHSLRRSKASTALMVLAIALGIGASMTMLTVLQVMSRDPLPQRSARLYTPHLDPLPTNYRAQTDYGNAADNLTWPDAMALLAAQPGVHQAAMAGGSVLVWPSHTRGLPFEVDGRYTTADFFPMFGVPMLRGSAWSAADDARHTRVVVLTDALAMKLFDGADPIGRSVRLNDTEFRVIGVSRDWHPQPMFYADPAAKGGFGKQDQFFLPLQTAVELKLPSSNSFFGWGPGSDDTDGKYTDASTAWLQFWMQLDDGPAVHRAQQFLYNYSAQQHASGRFERAPEQARLFPLMGWLAQLNLVPDDVRLQSWLALGFWVVCMTNIVALLLAKFLRRSGEVSVRRAMGARRGDIFMQFGVEAALVGGCGGLLGMAVAAFGLWSVRQRPDDYAAAAHLHAGTLLLTLAGATLGSLLAGLLPAWRASAVPPALHLKTQ